MHIEAPWTVEQVVRADQWQRAMTVHPYTCPNRQTGHPYEILYGDHGALRPTMQGWICAYCLYTQNWAHDFTLNEEPPVLDDYYV